MTETTTDLTTLPPGPVIKGKLSRDDIVVVRTPQQHLTPRDRRPRCGIATRKDSYGAVA